MVLETVPPVRVLHVIHAKTDLPDVGARVESFMSALRDQTLSIAIWGSGAIGSSAAYYLGRAGFRCICYDVSPERVTEIQAGKFQSTAPDAAQSSEGIAVTATTDWHDLDSESVGVHIVAVPTERAAEPSAAALADVIPSIAAVVRAGAPHEFTPVVSIESTILPSWVGGVIASGLESAGLSPNEDILIGAAPRRDWFNGADYTIETLPRIVGGCNPLTTALLVALYGTVCHTVQPALDAQHAAFTKVIENVIRYQGITFGNSLALAFPQYDMRHVLRLASTKWNIPYYYPSLGIGGHCIPLAPQYVLEEGGPGNLFLSSVHEAIEFNETYFSDLYDQELKALIGDKRSLGVLGLAYTANAKMHKLSPSFAILDTLRDIPRLRLHDPFYSADEIYDLCSVPRLRFPEDIADCDALILVTSHADYIDSPIEKYVRPGTVVIDNTGVWSRREFAAGVIYYEIGRILGQPGPPGEPFSPGADNSPV